MSKKITKNINRINDMTLIATVDIGKKKNYGYACTLKGDEIEVFGFHNTGEGFKKFYKIVNKYKEQKGLEELVVAIESTGSYGEAFQHYLNKRKVKLLQVNPMHTKRVKELQGNSPNKNDKKDPRVIADIIKLGKALSVVIPEGSAAELRRLAHLRESKLEDKGRSYNRIESYIALIFPEFSHIMKNLKTKTAIYLLTYYPTPGSIIELGIEELTRVMKKVSRSRIGKERAIELYNAAESSGGITEGLDSIVYSISLSLNEVTIYAKQIEEIEKKLEEYLADIDYSQFILSIKGIGIVSAAVLIGEVGDFRKYKNEKELLKLAGLNLFEISSGRHSGARHITKRGRSLMRKILFLISLNMVRKGGIMHEKYQKYLEREMPKMKALIAISRKILSVIFALVRDKTEYKLNYGEYTKAA